MLYIVYLILFANILIGSTGSTVLKALIMPPVRRYHIHIFLPVIQNSRNPAMNAGIKVVFYPR